ncbi:hypothetical protein [Haloterrigena alkaliphila]|uniref:Type I restriction enzyme R protein N-terminal domain-containing protein n=1 Tax=Haloterrigena alkaliphila TaxID=2816475 RepID=A0A8A2VBJ9_9EURY|nr:hypothetical protein [Haloterrigena alkaliphila]QSW98097.1 hypothetical protein J0X25_11820 [Haloterrigena alkaliphila]
MSALDLDAYVSRARALVGSTPPATRRETRAWLVEPFLETLGWDVHDEACLTDATVDGSPLEYVLAVGGVPALLVAVESYSESLEKARAVDLLETMAWTGIDRAIYTNGRDYLLLAGTTDVDRLACQLPELGEHESTVAHYTRETIGQRLERHARPFVARQLAVERETLVDAIVAELTDAADQSGTYSAEFESAADRFVDRLVASFADDDRRAAGELESAPDADVSIEFSETTISGTDHSTDAESSAAESPEPSRTAETDSRAPKEDAASERGDDAAADGEPKPLPDDGDSDRSHDSRSDQAASEDDDESDGEYVVRFFNDRGSIGAIGHSSADRALVATAEYLFERGLSGVTVPWSPDESDGARAVMNESPTHPDGTPMSAPEQLSNGLYLETAGSVDERATRLEALVDRAGLRAMLTGDWESE